jgi:hypothetical protein
MSSSVKAPTMPFLPAYTFTYLARILTRGLKYPAGRGIDNRCDATGLSVKSVFCRHNFPLNLE